MPIQIIPATITLFAELTNVGTNTLVELLNVPPEAVKLGECAAANGAVIEDPPARFFVTETLFGRMQPQSLASG